MREFEKYWFEYIRSTRARGCVLARDDKAVTGSKWHTWLNLARVCSGLALVYVWLGAVRPCHFSVGIQRTSIMHARRSCSWPAPAYVCGGRLGLVACRRAIHRHQPWLRDTSEVEKCVRPKASIVLVRRKVGARSWALCHACMSCMRHIGRKWVIALFRCKISSGAVITR